MSPRYVSLYDQIRKHESEEKQIRMQKSQLATSRSEAYLPNNYQLRILLIKILKRF